MYMHTTCLAYLVVLHLISLTVLGEEYNLQSSSLPLFYIRLLVNLC